MPVRRLPKCVQEWGNTGLILAAMHGHTTAIWITDGKDKARAWCMAADDDDARLHHGDTGGCFSRGRQGLGVA